MFSTSAAYSSVAQKSCPTDGLYVQDTVPAEVYNSEKGVTEHYGWTVLFWYWTTLFIGFVQSLIAVVFLVMGTGQTATASEKNDNYSNTTVINTIGDIAYNEDATIGIPAAFLFLSTSLFILFLVHLCTSKCVGGSKGSETLKLFEAWIPVMTFYLFNAICMLVLLVKVFSVSNRQLNDEDNSSLMHRCEVDEDGNSRRHSHHYCYPIGNDIVNWFVFTFLYQLPFAVYAGSFMDTSASLRHAVHALMETLKKTRAV
jgi:hypothetical protein